VGCDNAWVEIDGKRMQSVPGSTHWGGGVSISALDQARIGQMMLDDGKANGRQAISAEWLHRMRIPCAIAPFYGYLIWLNHERRIALAVRWIDNAHADAFFSQVLMALDAPG
jgi:CubicO group peptidase (beta-lactamase class C family)